MIDIHEHMYASIQPNLEHVASHDQSSLNHLHEKLCDSSCSNDEAIREMFLYAKDLIKDNVDNDRIPVIGLVRTAEESYRKEQGSSTGVYEMLQSLQDLGIKVLLIDYNKIVDFEEIEKESLKSAGGDDTLAKQLELEKIQLGLEEFVKDNKINSIVIPGNFYNLNTAPYPPTPNRQLITEAISKMVDDDPTIHLLPICGGLQGMMHAKGIELARIDEMLEEHLDHRISRPNTQSENAALNKINVVEESKLADLVRFLQDDDSFFYLPDLHSSAINNSPENIQKLESLGYKIVAYSNDGIIEAIEDKSGNIYFQPHPEALLVKARANYCLHDKEREQSTLLSMLVLVDFLYHYDKEQDETSPSFNEKLSEDQENK